MAREEFTEAQRNSAFAENAAWLRRHKVDGVAIAETFIHLLESGHIYYCENCLFCHSDRRFFDVDHLVPDRSFNLWKKHRDARLAINMMILCKSTSKGDLGCNQSKGARSHVPLRRGLAYTRHDVDMNYVPIDERPFDWAKAL